MRKPHELKLWMVLAAFGCCLIPQSGPGQLLTVESWPTMKLGPPQEPARTPQVLEFAPPEPPIQKTIVFDAVKPPVPSIVVFEPMDAARPKSSNVPGLALPITNMPRMPTGPAKETGAPPIAPPDEKPMERPRFGPVVGVDLDAPVEVEPPSVPAWSKRLTSTLVYWTNAPIQIIPVETASTTVRFDAPVPRESLIVLDDEVQPQPMPPPAPSFTPPHESEDSTRQRQRMTPMQIYLDRLGSPNGTPRLAPAYWRLATLSYAPPPRQRRIEGVIPWVFSPVARVCETMLWPLRALAEPFREFD